MISYTLTDLLEVLAAKALRRVETVRLLHRRVEKGLLSVGLKIHWKGDTTFLEPLIACLGGRDKVLEVNYYRQAAAATCLVLPPVGSARVAIHLLRAIEEYTGPRIFGNRSVTVQICSPGRLPPVHSAVLGIMCYLSSDTLRRFDQSDLKTTFSEDLLYPRGRRLILYDADGMFDRGFEWWSRFEKYLIRQSNLPFDSGRSDLLNPSCSETDIRNANLIATLLCHELHGGYWSDMGRRFLDDVFQLLEQHMLLGLTRVAWVHSGTENLFARHNDELFQAVLSELQAYAFADASRIMKARNRREQWGGSSPVERGILFEAREIMARYRNELNESAKILMSSGGVQ